MENQNGPKQGLSKLQVASALKEARGGDHALRGSHTADRAVTYTQETLILHEAKTGAENLDLLAYAMHFVSKGISVPCKGCGKPIPPERLDAMNNAVDHCVPCLSSKEAQATSGPRRGGPTTRF